MNGFNRLLVGLVLLVFSAEAYGQKADTVKAYRFIGGGVTATTNGISPIPTFSLGKPAALFDLSVGNKRLSFEPQFRFSMKGEPWSFLFWWRYKAVKTQRFTFNMGTHLAVAFRTLNSDLAGVLTPMSVSQRYLAFEFVPNFVVAKNITVGMYYLTSHGFDPGTTNFNNFLTLNANFSRIPISRNFYFKINPQVYYLRLDHRDGYYFTENLTFARNNFPLSISSIVNKVIKTSIPGNNFTWNVSLIYSFRKEFDEK